VEAKGFEATRGAAHRVTPRRYRFETQSALRRLRSRADRIAPRQSPHEPLTATGVSADVRSYCVSAGSAARPMGQSSGPALRASVSSIATC
jgi:hypothetical protein